MSNSNFWYYIIFAVVILHVIVGFGYVVYKMSPKKKVTNNKTEASDKTDGLTNDDK